MTNPHPSLNFGGAKAVVGMIHVAALPGCPHHALPAAGIVDLAVEEAHQLADAGCDALLIENMHDRPYLNREVGPEVVACMTAVAAAVRRAVDRPLGVQVLAGANRHALAIAQAGGADFIRAEGFVFAHVADEGLMSSADAGPLLRYRKQIAAENVAIIVDIKKKHASHSITADVDLTETARAAEFFGADGLVVTGVATARPADPADVLCVCETASVPVAIGSGLTPESLPLYWPHADMFIVGSFVKTAGLWSNPIDPERLKLFMDAVGRLRGAQPA